MDGFNRQEDEFGGNRKRDKNERRRPYFVPDEAGSCDISAESGSTQGTGELGSIGADDVTPFNINRGIGTEKKNIRGMFATPEDIQKMVGHGHKKKDIEPKDPKKPPYANYDPTDPFGGNAEPDPDHERPHR